MKIITNIPFHLCKAQYRKEVKSIFEKYSSEIIMIATFRFCNFLGNYELIYPDEWPEIGVTMSIYDSKKQKSFYKQPKNLLEYASVYSEDIKNKYYYFHNTDFTKPTSKHYKKLLFLEIKPEYFQYRTCNQYVKKAQKRTIPIIKKEYKEIIEKK